MERKTLINKEEIVFYETFQSSFNIIFDVGCREDTSYVDVSEGKEFHLFEPNPSFYKACKDKLDTEKNKVFLNNFGLGNKTEEKNYYEDGQSFLKRHVDFKSVSEPILLKVKRFSEYLLENNIKEIDFLKIDVEGYEPDILKDNIDFIKQNVKCVQFEYASTWLDREDNETIGTMRDIYKETFNIYVLHNEDNPISKFCNAFLTPILNEEDIKVIDSYVANSYGFEIIMIKKGIEN